MGEDFRYAPSVSRARQVLDSVGAFEYAGDVVYIEIFRTPAIVLNSFEAARDLLDKRSAIYSDRPRLVLLMEMYVFCSAIACKSFAESYLHPRRLRARTLVGLPYGDEFRKRRKWMFDAAGNKATLRGYHNIQYREVRKLLRNLSRQPDQFSQHLHL